MGGVTDLRHVCSRDLDVDGILHRCQWGVPVNCDLEKAIGAALKSFPPSDNPTVSANAMRAVILAQVPSIESLQRQLAFIENVPDIGFTGLDPGTQQRTVDMIRRLIAQRQAG